MVTLVGTQHDFSAALKELCELDYDAIEAYQAAIDRLENSRFQEKFFEFMADHERHVSEICKILTAHGQPPIEGASIKRFLTKGKVVIAGLVGDETILRAMLSNEIDTNTAYERLNNFKDKWPDSVEVLMNGLADEKRHKAWIEQSIG